jgi:hypothetical protein
MHTIAIVVHATSAIVAFIIGIILIFQRNALRQLQLARAFLVFLILMEIFLVIAILSHVTSLSTITQIIFGVLVILGLYMIWRAVQALTFLTKQHQEDQLKVIDHVGFVLISLFDGFAIVSALDLQAPGWLVAVIAVAAVGVGIYGINLRKKTLKMQMIQNSSSR